MAQKKCVIDLLLKAKNEYSSRLVYLYVSRSNAAALGLYYAVGFIDIETSLDNPWAGRDDIKKMSFSL